RLRAGCACGTAPATTITPATNAATSPRFISLGGRRPARQREREDVRARRGAEEAAAAGGDNDVLPAVLAEEGHRRGVRARRQFRLPQLPAGLRLEGAETAVDRRADEDHAAGGCDAAADVQRAGLVE